MESWASMEKDEETCTIISDLFELNQINELFVSIETRTDICSSRLNNSKRKKAFDLIVYYGNNGNIFTNAEHTLCPYTPNHWSGMINSLSHTTS